MVNLRMAPCLAREHVLRQQPPQHGLDQTKLSHEGILEAIWGPSYRSEHRLLHDAVSRLRHRFQEIGVEKDPITTLYGAGYRFDEPGA